MKMQDIVYDEYPWTLWSVVIKNPDEGFTEEDVALRTAFYDNKPYEKVTLFENYDDVGFSAQIFPNEIFLHSKYHTLIGIKPLEKELIINHDYRDDRFIRKMRVDGPVIHMEPDYGYTIPITKTKLIKQKFNNVVLGYKIIDLLKKETEMNKQELMQKLGFSRSKLDLLLKKLYKIVKAEKRDRRNYYTLWSVCKKCRRHIIPELGSCPGGC